jgi:hypothetical protein
MQNEMLEALVELERRSGAFLDPEYRDWLIENKSPERVKEFLEKAKDSEIRAMADGLFYNDLREPFIAADIPAVTLAPTAKALYPASNHPILGSQYFGRVGKKIEIYLFGRMTTGTTPGNLTIDVYYGTGADANGVILASSAAVALTASQTSLSWECKVKVHCRSTGNVGTLFCTGKFQANVAVLASTLQPMMIPASLPVVSAACDLTVANLISIQARRSGSTGETMQVHDLEFIAKN